MHRLEQFISPLSEKMSSTFPLSSCISVATGKHVRAAIRIPNPLPSNSIFYIATGTCSANLQPPDGQILAFRRHVTLSNVVAILCGAGVGNLVLLVSAYQNFVAFSFHIFIISVQVHTQIFIVIPSHTIYCCFY
jgi:hypothetical protein